MGYFELKQQLNQKRNSGSTVSSKGTSYFALKEKALPTIEALRSQRQKQQEEKAKQEKLEQINANIEKYKQEAKEAGSLWGLAKNTVKGVGSALLGFGKEILRAPATIPLKVVQSLTEAATGKPQVYTPQTGVEKFVYGDTRQSYQQDQSGITKWTQEKGLGKGASTAIGAGVAGAEVLADLALPGMASKIFKSAIGKSILSKMGVKSSKVVEAVSKGTTTEKEIVDIFEEKGLKGVEEVVAEPKPLKPGELAPVVKEIEEKTGTKLKPSEALQVKADLEKGISKEAIINDIIEPPKRTTKPVEPPKVEKGIKTPESPLIQEARKYKSAEEFVKSQSLYHGTPNELEGGALKFGAGKQLKKGGYMGGHFLTDTQEIADNFSFGGKVYQASGEIKNKVLDVNKSKKLFQDFVGKKYKTSDGELVEFTKQEFDYMFPEGKADWSTLNTDLAEQIAKKQGKIGVAIPEYAGGKQGMTYQIFEDNIPVKTKEELTDIWNKSQPLQEGVKKITKGELPKIETTPSKVAKSIEAKAIEEKLTKGFGDIAGYEKITIKDQAQKTAKLLDEEYDNAVKMVRGEIPVKEGIKPEMLIKTMEDYAQAKGDVNLLRDIAKSPLVSETSAHAQSLRILAERNPESAVANIKRVAEERAATFEKKTGKSISKAKKEIADEIKSKAKQKIPTREDWNKFIEEIKC